MGFFREPCSLMDRPSDFGYMGFAFNYPSRPKDKLGAGERDRCN